MCVPRSKCKAEMDHVEFLEVHSASKPISSAALAIAGTSFNETGGRDASNFIIPQILKFYRAILLEWKWSSCFDNQRPPSQSRLWPSPDHAGVIHDVLFNGHGFIAKLRYPHADFDIIAKMDRRKESDVRVRNDHANLHKGLVVSIQTPMDHIRTRACSKKVRYLALLRCPCGSRSP